MRKLILLCAYLLGVATMADAKVPVVTASRGSDDITRTLNLPKGKATIVRLPASVKEILVANPAVIDTVIRSSEQIYVFGKAAGQTNVFFFDEKGRQQAALEVNVGQDVEMLQKMLRDAIPNGNINLKAVGESIAMSGTVITAADASNAVALIQKIATGAQIINNLKVSGQEQVNIRVKVSEVKRSITKQLGIDWSTAFNFGNNLQFGLNTVGGALSPALPSVGTGAYTLLGTNFDTALTGVGILPSTVSSAGVSAALSQLISLVNQGSGLIESGEAAVASGRAAQAAATTAQERAAAQATIDAGIAQRSKGQALVAKYEPLATDLGQKINNATQYNGQPTRTIGYQGAKAAADAALTALENHALARTLAEPTLTAISGESAKFLSGGQFPYPVAGSLGATSIQFKDYGMSLAFTPTVLAHNRINLKVNTTFSTLQAGTSGGVPGLNTRTAETVVEVPSGGTMVLAGMLQENNNRSLQGTPGLKELPIIGPATNSNGWNGDETELVILATPYLVQPTHISKLALPTDGYAPPSDGDLYLGGNMAAVYGDDDNRKATNSERTARGADGAASRSAPAARMSQVLE